MHPSLRVIVFVAAVLTLVLVSTLLVAAYERGAQRFRFSRGQAVTGTTTATTAVSIDAIYLNPELGLILHYPSNWIPEQGGVSAMTLPTRFRGVDGFFELAVTGEPGMTLSLAVNDLAYGEEQPYGANPRITAITVSGQEGRLIAATDPNITDAAILVPFPRPVTLNGQSAAFLVLHTDQAHLEALAAQLRFVRNQSGEITGLPNILVYEPRSNDVVDGTVSIVGVARVFPASPAGRENTLSLRLVDPYTNRVFLEQTTMATAPNAGAYGTFAIDLNFPRIENLRSATLEVFQASPRDGLPARQAGTPTDVVAIPLRFAP